MIEYKFEINKEACFTYWAQSLIKWHWYFNKEEYRYYLGISDDLNYDEQIALQKLKKLLQREDTGFLWLWERYLSGKIVNQNDYLEWESINKILKNRFEKIWQKELLKLSDWQSILQALSYNKLNEIFLRIANFFDVDIEAKKTIIVKLFFYHNKNSLAGHAKKEFNNLIILNLSNLDIECINKVVNVLAHETIHLIEYSSPISNVLLKNSYFKILKSRLSKNKLSSFLNYLFKRIFIILKKKKLRLSFEEGPKWRYLFTESVISSIAGIRTNNSYINQKLFNQKNMSQENHINEFNYERHKTKYNIQIKIVASQLINLTKEYLDNNKKIDKDYCDEVAKIWLEIYNNK